MKLQELADKVQGKIEVEVPDVEVAGVYVGDLLSDVMGHAGEDSALVTVQNHLNTIAVCTLAGVVAVVVCHARPIPDDMREAARREGVAIVVTPLCQYAAAQALGELPPAVR